MTRPPPQPAAARRRGFTLLEILIVVAIIGVLSTLLVIGVDKLLVSSRRQQTRSTFATLTAMYAEYDRVAHPHFAPSNMPCPQNVSADLNPVTGNSPQATDTSPANRFGAAVWFTRDVMFNLRSAPVNAAALSKVASSGLMTFPTNNPPPTPSGPFYPDLTLMFPKPYYANLPKWLAANAYLPFSSDQPSGSSFYGRVYVPDITDPANTRYAYYECINPVALGSAASFLAPDPGHWLAAYPVMTVSASGTITPSDNAVPVVLDAWGNPIIFVPGGTLGVTPDVTNLVNGVVKPGTGAMASGSGAAAIAIQARSPDGRPFWASAGPDGDFSKGDDNLYSFEK